MIEWVDKIVVFCGLEKCPRYVRDSSKLVHIPIVDPGANIKGLEDYSEEILKGMRKSRDQIDKIVKKLL